MANIHLLVMGLPSTGKTTFIAALWHVVSSKEVPNSLIAHELQPTRDHLNAITKLWRDTKSIPRTLVKAERHVQMNLSTSDNGMRYEVYLPDSSGEAFKRIFETRKWSPEFNALVKTSVGVLFFVHPSHIVRPQRIDETVEQMIDSLEKEEDQNSVAQTSGNKAKPWNAAHSTSQAKFVDLLQLVIRARQKKGLRIGVVISAWDIVKDQNLSPKEWLSKEAPLFSQYLTSIKAKFPTEIFGASAQGADYDQSAALQEFIKASERINLVAGSDSSHDLSLPIKWLIA